ncbi:MAG: hypothetical protein P4L30_00965 [Candidatus Limnocylindrales bacterium]|nr:hypothetical protein [Candidatus Limnocylindrales bacterium]
MRHVRAFGAFWYDFLVGDRPELFLGPIVALVLAWLLVGAGVTPGVTGIVFFLAVCAIGALSLYLTTRPRA